MDEREKIKFRIELGIQDHGEIFHRELIKALKHEKNRFSTEEMDKTLVDCIADALIAANIGDVTEWKEKVECAKRILQIPTLPGGKTDLSYFEYKGERIQDIAHQRDEYKHRAEVAEKALKLVSERDELADVFCEARGGEDCDFRCNTCLYNHFLQQAEREIKEEKEE